MMPLKSNPPLVSVIMTAYNEERYIKQAIESVLQQTFTDFELILINDGSTDKTDEIIKSFIDDRIRYVHNERNLRLIACLNIGLELAQGKYIARMDSDDICYPNRLKTQFDFLESNFDIGILGSNLEVFGDNTGLMKYPELDADIKLRLLTTSAFGNNVVMIRSDILKKIEFKFHAEYIHAEDYKAWTEIIKYTGGYNFQEPLMKYRAHSSSVSNKYKHIQRHTRNRIRAEYILNCLGIDKNDANYKTYFESIVNIVGRKRVLTYKVLIKLNNKNTYFDNESFKSILSTNWYLDCLDAIDERKLTVLFKYFFVLLIDFRPKVVKNYFNLIKHYLKYS